MHFPDRFSDSLSTLAIAAAPMLFVLLWSTGFIGARFGLPYIEPMTFLAVRMVFVVLILGAFALIVRARWPRGPEIGHSLVASSLLHGLYLGGVFTAISQGVPAGISALIPGLQPILTSTIANRFMGEKVTRLQWLGLVLGLIGVALVLHDRAIVNAGSAARLGRELRLAHRHHARHALSEAFLRRHRLAHRQPGAIYRRHAAVRPRRLRLRDARDPLDRRTRLRHGLAGARAVDRRGRADVLADPPLGGDRLRQPVLSGAGGDRACSPFSCSARSWTRCRSPAWWSAPSAWSWSTAARRSRRRPQTINDYFPRSSTICVCVTSAHSLPSPRVTRVCQTMVVRPRCSGVHSA